MDIKGFYVKHKEAIIVLGVLLVLYFLFVGTAPLKSMTNSASSYAMDSVQQQYSNPESSADMAGKRSLMSISPPVVQDEAGFYPEEQKRIQKNANLAIEVEQDAYKEAIDELNSIIERNKGFSVNVNEYKSYYYDKEYRTYSITLKVPVDNFEAASDQLKLIGNVKSYNAYSNDLTTQYFDTKSYLDSYIKEKARIEELLNKADKIEDIIKIEEKLADLQRTIDSYQMQLKNLERVTDYSTISVSIEEKKPVSEAVYRMTGLKELLRNAIGSFDTLFVFVSSIIGWIIGILVVYGIYKGVKRLRSK